jgi:hypothetical protein
MDKLARELELLEVDAAGSRVARLKDGERAFLLEAFPQVPIAPGPPRPGRCLQAAAPPWV